MSVTKTEGVARELYRAGVPHLLIGMMLERGPVFVIDRLPREASERSVREIAAKSGATVRITEGRVRSGAAGLKLFRGAPVVKEVVLQRRPGDKKYSLALLAHELGHLENLQSPAMRRWSRIAEPLSLTSAVLAAAPEVPPRIRKALLLSMVPHVAGEALASYRGAEILHREGKLKKRHVLMLTMPVLNRAGMGLVAYGTGKLLSYPVEKYLQESREDLEPVRGYTRRRRGKLEVVRSYLRRVRR